MTVMALPLNQIGYNRRRSSFCPSAQWYSIAMSRPSLYPDSCRP
jgi:hypothetical protein